ncbi:MAG: hypothetical protein FJX68_15115 [Alphaproteobacteria bacterium]|nr:hypothetical protein [Alphaproteobacteria bacterium]
MKRSGLELCLLGALLAPASFALTLISGHAQGFPYELFPVGPLRPAAQGGFHYADDVNEAGIVSGFFKEDTDGSSDVFLWDSISASFLPLGSLPTGFTNRVAPARLNNSNHLVGHAHGLIGVRAFVSSDGITTILDDLPGSTLPGAIGGIAHDINDSGFVVGQSGVRNPTIWIDEIPIPLQLLPGFIGGLAQGINEDGQVAGYICKDTSCSLRGAVLWTNNVPTLLGPESEFSEAQSVNDIGIVGGYQLFPASPQHCGGPRLTIWNSTGILRQIPALGFVFDINNSNLAVGTTTLGSAGCTTNFAFLWDEENRIFDLNNQIDPRIGWRLIEAHGINDFGQIVGRAKNQFGNEQGFLLTPTGEPLVLHPTVVPAPASLSLFTLSLAGLLVLRRRLA